MITNQPRDEHRGPGSMFGTPRCYAAARGAC